MGQRAGDFRSSQGPGKCGERKRQQHHGETRARSRIAGHNSAIEAWPRMAARIPSRESVTGTQPPDPLEWPGGAQLTGYITPLATPETPRNSHFARIAPL